MMGRSIWKVVVARALGLVCYFGGFFLLLFVGIDIYLSPPERSLANASIAHLGPMALAVLLLVIGGGLSRAFGGGIGGRMGHVGDTVGFLGGSIDRIDRDGRRRSRESRRSVTPRDGSTVVYRGGPALTVCQECGGTNERGYRFCGHCSSKLPA